MGEVLAMGRAIELARRGEGFVEPNPQVGAVVLTADGRVVGEGWHARYGGPHAEVVALEAAGESAYGGTLVVTLEPCCHHGKTPPCTDAVSPPGSAGWLLARAIPSRRLPAGGSRVCVPPALRSRVGFFQLRPSVSPRHFAASSPRADRG